MNAAVLHYYRDSVKEHYGEQKTIKTIKKESGHAVEHLRAKVSNSVSSQN